MFINPQTDLHDAAKMATINTHRGEPGYEATSTIQPRWLPMYACSALTLHKVSHFVLAISTMIVCMFSLHDVTTPINNAINANKFQSSETHKITKTHNSPCCLKVGYVGGDLCWGTAAPSLLNGWTPAPIAGL